MNSYTIKNPFHAKIIERDSLTKEGSTKKTYRLVLDISGSNIHYQVGDSIGIFPQNDPEQVHFILKVLQLDRTATVQDPRSDQTYSLEDYLLKKANINLLNKKILYWALNTLSEESKKSELHEFLKPEHKEALKQYLQSISLWDFLSKYCPSTAPQEFVNVLSPMLPRFYSIASSHLADHNTIELVVGYIRYEANGHLRKGVCSHYLCTLAPMFEPCVPIYHHPATNFTLPKDTSKPIIMIGPGTGIAPYRGFMQERVLTKSSPKNWLFFGECNRDTDFFYEDYWNQLVKANFLKLSTAFSRDQDHKIYVQHIIKQEADTLWEWIEEGAIIYVCGDAKYMAKDVDQTLAEIIMEKKGLDEKEAIQFLRHMHKENRYLRDVY